MSDPRRRIPGLDRLLESQEVGRLLDRWPRSRVVVALREALEGVRREVAEVAEATAPRKGITPGPLESPAPYARAAERFLSEADQPSLLPVINATGVVLHTNLGRAPLAPPAREAMERTTRGYTNLEMDLEAGERGSRYVHCAGLLSELTGAEDALVVNNCAAALTLAVNTLARGRAVLVSRGELVEIGGGFRIPEILERAGVELVEVGSTNRTRLADYRDAASRSSAAAVLKVHRSNFRVTGFTEETGLDELASLTGELGLHLIHDLGTGLMVDPARLGLPDEPQPAGSLLAGAHLVAFSGDKLLGGPQAGILVGRAERIEALRQNPLCRAFRVDRGTLAALEATLQLYRDPDLAVRTIPVLRMLATPPDALEARARAVAERIEAAGAGIDVAPGKGAVGGGTFPGVELESWTVRIAPAGSTSRLARALRAADRPVVGRVEEERMVLDLRTVAPDEEDRVVEAVNGALSGEVADGAEA